MTQLYPIVLETEDNGAVSAYVPGLPVYAAADTHAKAERAIRAVLTAYLEAHPDSRPEARVRVARSRPQHGRRSTSSAPRLSWARIGARRRRAPRENGRLGGRPRKAEPTQPRRAKRSR